jgi:hypothetical protein
MAAVQKLQKKGSQEGDSFDEPENQYLRDRGRHDFGHERSRQPWRRAIRLLWATLRMADHPAVAAGKRYGVNEDQSVNHATSALRNAI